MSSKRKSKELAEAIAGVLDDYGITEREFGKTRSGHQYVRFERKGHKLMYVFPSTPGDRRAIRNSMAGVRREILSCDR